MFSNKVKFLPFLLFAVLSIFLASCNSEDDTTVIEEENFTQSAMANLQSNSVGRNHCLEFVFPITIQFVDETTADVESYDDMKTTIDAWFADNDVEKTRENRPELVFPINVVNDEGEVIEVASQEELRALGRECRGGRGGCKGEACFELVYPISVDFNGDVQAFDDKVVMRAAIKAYFRENGRDAERPTLVFPITVEYEDGTTAVANDKDELKALKEACNDDEEG